MSVDLRVREKSRLTRDVYPNGISPSDSCLIFFSFLYQQPAEREEMINPWKTKYTASSVSLFIVLNNDSCRALFSCRVRKKHLTLRNTIKCWRIHWYFPCSADQRSLSNTNQTDGCNHSTVKHCLESFDGLILKTRRWIIDSPGHAFQRTSSSTNERWITDCAHTISLLDQSHWSVHTDET